MTTIRSFDPNVDLQAVLDLWRTAGTGVQLSPSDRPEEIHKKLQRDPDLFLIAEQGSRIVGSVLGGFDGRRGMVYHLAVDQSSRRRGIGRALMAELESRLRAKGCLKYYLLITHDNAEGMDFYRQLGWERMDLHVMGKVIE
ncbi:MAG TPA: GNAT family acetyltransferase [Anaerolineae bacterium]|nr:GNAT family acetyltransferase [Anaerolineae bacterium]